MSEIQVAVLGLGNMGAGMALRLVDRGFGVTVHNRTREKAAAAVAAGAVAAATAADAAAAADVVLLSLSDEAAVESVLFGEVAPVLRPGAVVVDTSTVSPGYACRAEDRLRARGAHRVEACVVGNPQQARGGHLRIFVAGAEETPREARPILAALGHQVVHMGDAGTATTTKLVFNLLLGAQVASLAEAVCYGVRAGLDRDVLLATIAASGFSSKVMSFRAEVMRERRYDPPAFRSMLMEKDLRMALEDAARLGVELTVLDHVRTRFATVLAQGDGNLDAAVVAEHIR